MKKMYNILKPLIFVCILLATLNPAKAELTNKERNILANKAKEIDLAKSLKPNFERDDFGYMGFKGGRPNNWNPW